MCSFKCTLLVILCNVVGVGAVGYFWGLLGALNFEVSFIGFLLILLAGYQKLKNTLKQAKEKVASKFVLGLEVNFSWSKIGAYALFLAGLLSLTHFRVFEPIPYLVGLGVCLGSVLGVYMLRNQRHS
ncbi:hypothetical protein [Helicobacter felis]|uniref:hypothetical protein n=1 Tax=Helicobacter felis TaxID=214 RepID=UPI000CF13307|nr:hypothetical protein [Helicobacter felis]